MLFPSVLIGLLFLQAQWPSPNTQRILLRQCGDRAFQAKDWEKAERCLGAYIAQNPNDGYAAYELGTSLLMMRDPGKMADGTFYYARAAVLMREPGLRSWVKREYTNVHRSPLGLDQYWEYVRTHGIAPPEVSEYPRPPVDMFGGNQLMMVEIRTSLQRPNGAQYFEDVLSGNTLPVMRGKLVAQRPEDHPRELLLSVETPGEADIRILLSKPLPYPARLGTSIDFEGVIKAWDQQPFALVFDVPVDGIHGWPKQQN
jgi:hypothetical protein